MWIGFRCLCWEWHSIKMNAKCGSIEDAQSVFNKMPSQDVVTWNAILRGCAMQLLGREALQQFWTDVLRIVQPDDMTFVCLLSALWPYRFGGWRHMLLCFNHHSLFGFCKTGTLPCMF
jgi:hypothetical protein